MKTYNVHVYVWAQPFGAPLVLTYLVPQHQDHTHPSYWKTIALEAEDSRRAKRLAGKTVRDELKRSGLYQAMTSSGTGCGINEFFPKKRSS